VAQSTMFAAQKELETLFYYLIEAKHDMDRVKDDLKDLYNKLETLVEVVAYEALRKEAGL
jgi:uncharacterized coiled-coil protein SlyX